MAGFAVARLTPATRQRVLLIDDDEAFRAVLSEELTERDFAVIEVGTGAAALAAVDEQRPDAALLDLGLPDMSGLDLLSDLRKAGVPVVVVSGRGGEIDVCVGLENGADDYLVKPFSFRELAVRLDHVIGRADGAHTSVIRSGSLSIDLDTREVFDGDRRIDLTAKEFGLLALLAGAPKRVFSRAQLLDMVWGSSPAWQSSGTISEHVYRLRRKLDPDRASRWIETVRGFGYRFSPDD